MKTNPSLNDMTTAGSPARISPVAKAARKYYADCLAEGMSTVAAFRKTEFTFGVERAQDAELTAKTQDESLATPMHSTNQASQHTPDTGDLATDSLADAGYWKGQARKAQATNKELLAALEWMQKSMEEYQQAILGGDEITLGMTMRADSGLDKARAALASAKGGAL